MKTVAKFLSYLLICMGLISSASVDHKVIGEIKMPNGTIAAFGIEVDPQAPAADSSWVIYRSEPQSEWESVQLFRNHPEGIQANCEFLRGIRSGVILTGYPCVRYGRTGS